MSIYLPLPEVGITCPSWWAGEGVIITRAKVCILGTPSMWKEEGWVYWGPWSVRFVLHKTSQERQSFGAAQLAACVLQSYRRTLRV